MPGSETPTAKADALPPALPVAPTPTPVPSTANPTAVSAFAGQLASGEATIDPVLGIIFHHRPDRWDDLTLLRGVAEILQNRLYEHGVFTFKQIALWSEANIREFSTLFGFKERINREKWCQQARDLHFLKYGEKI
jgi:predicted flap endonuclease-1-like 5' DNA nuclease